MTDNPPIEISPRGETRYSIIWLHGLGADGQDFLPIVEELGITETLGLRFVFPSAPMRPVTINNGCVMPAWYDIRQPDLQQQVDEAGIEASCTYLQALVSREQARGLALDHILLAGFSQGGVIALRTALASPQPLAGVLALSTYLPPGGVARVPPLAVFQGHGRFDEIVPIGAGQATRDQLRALGHRVDWRDYPMAHAVCQPEIDDIRAWLQQRCGGD